MPLYEYYCGDCDLKFDALGKMSEAGGWIYCPTCHNKAIQVLSAFNYHNVPTFLQKKREDLAEHLIDIEQRKEREPHLNFNKHLEGAKKRVGAQREMKKKIERVAGKGPDAPRKYKEIMGAKRLLEKQDSWKTD